LSKQAEVVSGVPQGSILWPLLFIIYIYNNDLPLCVIQSITDMFTDDTSLTTSGNTLQEVNSNLQKDLDNTCKCNGSECIEI
jgi:hypothetical protein